MSTGNFCRRQPALFNTRKMAGPFLPRSGGATLCQRNNNLMAVKKRGKPLESYSVEDLKNNLPLAAAVNPLVNRLVCGNTRTKLCLVSVLIL